MNLSVPTSQLSNYDMETYFLLIFILPCSFYLSLMLYFLFSLWVCMASLFPFLDSSLCLKIPLTCHWPFSLILSQSKDPFGKYTSTQCIKRLFHSTLSYFLKIMVKIYSFSHCRVHGALLLIVVARSGSSSEHWLQLTHKMIWSSSHNLLLLAFSLSCMISLYFLSVK